MVVVGVGVGQDDATVAEDVRGPDGPYRVTARYLVGRDGPHSSRLARMAEPTIWERRKRPVDVPSCQGRAPAVVCAV
ncbi:hypothetical protein [Streptomyces mirabilis]|uniref:hypothetical protein n=1 Tax=Streptomyces mirabilis TaxID=68239 RepID=UPI00369BBACC